MTAKLTFRLDSGTHGIKIIEQQPGDPKPAPKEHVLAKVPERTEVQFQPGTIFTFVQGDPIPKEDS